MNLALAAQPEKTNGTSANGVAIRKFQAGARAMNLGIFGRKMPMLDAPQMIQRINADAHCSIKIIGPKAADILLETEAGRLRDFAAGVFGNEFAFAFPVDVFIAYERTFAAMRPGICANGACLYMNGKKLNGTNAVRVRDFGEDDIQRNGDLLVKITDHSRIIELQNFPHLSGIYNTDKETIMPCGEEGEDAKGEGAREFTRDAVPYVGYLLRLLDSRMEGAKTIAALQELAKEVGIIVEIPEVDVETVSRLAI